MQPYEMRLSAALGVDKPLQALLATVDVVHAMHRHRGVVVDPEDVVATCVATGFGHEAAGRRGALAGSNARQRFVADARHRVVAARQPEQHRRVAARLPLFVEQPHARLSLVDDDERRRAVVAREQHARQCRLRVARHRGFARATAAATLAGSVALASSTGFAGSVACAGDGFACELGVGVLGFC